MKVNNNMQKAIAKIPGFLLALILILGISSCASGNKYGEGAKNWKKNGKTCNCPKLGLIYHGSVKTYNRT